MDRRPRLMCILAHPDDETLGFGGTLAKYAADGVETSVLTATRGQYGWFGAPDENPGPEELGRIREQEFRAATSMLGVREVTLLDYVDGELDSAPAAEIIPQIVAFIRRIRPDVVLSFGYDGIYGHPDHIAISQFALSAVVAAASDDSGHDGEPHRVTKMYYRASGPEYMRGYEEAFGDLVMHIDGQERRSRGWQEWSITTRIDATDHWQRVWDAVRCHRTQLPFYDKLMRLPDDRHRYLWGTQEYYRALSLVNGGRAEEHDLFEGMR